MLARSLLLIALSSAVVAAQVQEGKLPAIIDPSGMATCQACEVNGQLRCCDAPPRTETNTTTIDIKHCIAACHWAGAYRCCHA